MIYRRIAGVILLVVGVVLLVIGIRASDSFADKMSVAFTDRLTQPTFWHIVIGSASILVGLFLASFGAWRKRN